MFIFAGTYEGFFYENNFTGTYEGFLCVFIFAGTYEGIFIVLQFTGTYEGIFVLTLSYLKFCSCAFIFAIYWYICEGYDTGDINLCVLNIFKRYIFIRYNFLNANLFL